MRQAALVVVSLLAGLSAFAGGMGRAAAQPGMTPAAPPPFAQSAPMAAPQPMPAMQGEPLSENTALALSLGGTVVSWGLLVASTRLTNDRDSANTLSSIGAIGTFFAPSFGHWYAGSYFTRGMGLRALGMGSTLIGVVSLVASLCDGDFSGGGGSECGDDSMGTGVAFLIAGAALYVGGTIDDVVTAPRKARKRNQQRGFGIGVGVAPVITHQSAGFALGGQF